MFILSNMAPSYETNIAHLHLISTYTLTCMTGQMNSVPAIITKEDQLGEIFKLTTLVPLNIDRKRGRENIYVNVCECFSTEKKKR